MKNLDEMKISELRGIGPKKAGYFEKLGIFCVADVLYSFPREYEDRTNIKRISELSSGEKALVEGSICGIKKSRYIKGRKRTLRLLVRDSSGAMEILFF